MSIKVREVKKVSRSSDNRQTRVREMNDDRTPIAPDTESLARVAFVVADATPVSDWHAPEVNEI